MKTIKMTAIPEPAPNTRSVLVPSFTGPAMQGKGAVNYACGNCGDVLAEKMEEGQIQNVVIKCFKCGKHSEFPTHSGLN